eukprot:scaffold205449_cov23-Cyclotella_meneghiniana.AAC.1
MGTIPLDGTNWIGNGSMSTSLTMELLLMMTPLYQLLTSKPARGTSDVLDHTECMHNNTNQIRARVDSSTGVGALRFGKFR